MLYKGHACFEGEHFPHSFKNSYLLRNFSAYFSDMIAKFQLLSIDIPNISNSLVTGILEFLHLKSSVASDFPITMA